MGASAMVWFESEMSPRDLGVKGLLPEAVLLGGGETFLQVPRDRSLGDCGVLGLGPFSSILLAGGYVSSFSLPQAPIMMCVLITGPKPLSLLIIDWNLQMVSLFSVMHPCAFHIVMCSPQRQMRQNKQKLCTVFYIIVPINGLQSSEKKKLNHFCHSRLPLLWPYFALTTQCLNHVHAVRSKGHFHPCQEES